MEGKIKGHKKGKKDRVYDKEKKGKRCKVNDNRKRGLEHKDRR